MNKELNGSDPIDRSVMRFDELALGARFIYANSGAKNPQIWIKISNEGCGTIAEYNADLIAHKNWIGQSICSAKESETEDLLVEFVG
jgi:hypothetical protein